MKTIVICYSLTGNTAWTARRLAEALGADLLELKSRKAYPDRGFRKFLRGGKSAMAAECPPLEPYDFHAGQYDRVIFAKLCRTKNILNNARVVQEILAETLLGPDELTAGRLRVSF